VAALVAYGWPGNVRELQNVLEYAALQAGAGSIGVEHLPAEVRAAPPAATTEPMARATAEPGANRDAVVGALEACQWNRSRAAARLGISRVTLWKRMKALGLVET
jgi:transcriptional regulator of acetoin/glycerol metabolism